MEERDLALELVEAGVGVDEPGVAEPGGAADGGVAVGGDPQRRRHGRPQRQLRALEPVARALGGDLLAGQQAAQHVELGLEQAPAAAPHAEGGVLDGAVADPDAGHDTPAGDRVERREVLRRLERVEQRQQDDPGAEAHLAGLGREPPQQRDGLQHLVGLGEEVLADQQRAEAQLGGERDLLDVLADRRSGARAGRVLGPDEQPERDVLRHGPQL